MPRLTPEERAAIRERESKATAGPWHSHNPDDSSSMNCYCVSALKIEPDVYWDDTTGIIAATLIQTPLTIGNNPKDGDKWEEDAEFIAAARTDIPRLLDDLDAVDAEIAALENPKPGDIESQAAAWVAVWKELEAAGIYSFIGDLRDMRGRTRAVEFIRHLAAAVAAQRERDAAIVRSVIPELGGRVQSLLEGLAKEIEESHP